MHQVVEIVYIARSKRLAMLVWLIQENDSKLGSFCATKTLIQHGELDNVEEAHASTFKWGCCVEDSTSRVALPRISSNVEVRPGTMHLGLRSCAGLLQRWKFASRWSKHGNPRSMRVEGDVMSIRNMASTSPFESDVFSYYSTPQPTFSTSCFAFHTLSATMVTTRNDDQTTGDAQGSQTQRTSKASPKTPLEKDATTNKVERGASGQAENCAVETKPNDNNDKDDPLPSTESSDDVVQFRPTVPQKRGFEEISNETRSATVTSLNENVPSDAMRLDRRPTPGRIINPRAVNEEGADPIPSRGNPDEWPASDAHYSNRSYRIVDSHGQMHDDPDAPQGPPKKKGRRNNPERAKWEAEQPLKDPNNTFHVIHLCHSRGKNGRPTYDNAGFQLDFKAVSDWMKPFRPRALTVKQCERLEKKVDNDRKMADIFFEEGAKPAEFDAHYQMGALKDRVSKDLGIMWHEVGLSQVQEWERKGYTKAKNGEYREFSEEYKQRMMDFMSGASLRSGKSAG